MMCGTDSKRRYRSTGQLSKGVGNVNIHVIKILDNSVLHKEEKPMFQMFHHMLNLHCVALMIKNKTYSSQVSRTRTDTIIGVQNIKIRPNIPNNESKD